LDTLNQFLALQHLAGEILVIDQTLQHQHATVSVLETLESDNRIAWHKLQNPSIPKAMNHALLTATHDVVLFVDDDVELTSELVYEHAMEHADSNVACVAGRVVQLWEKDLGKCEDAWLNGRVADPDSFRFSSDKRRSVERFAGGNFSVKRQIALEIGGFDENFVSVAYRYEAEFSERLLRAGHSIQFQPTASLTHLKVNTGGTRSFGHHLRSIKPGHSVGKYYYLLSSNRLPNRIKRFVLEPFKAVRTKHHLFRPWWIPATLIAELSGMVWACWLAIRGRKYIGAREARNSRIAK
jgi:GT2 family glycosyltransferase